VDHAARLARLAEEVTAMTAALRQADPAAEVPHCPGWTSSDLTAHLTAVHRWALAALDADGPPPFDEAPATADDYAAAGRALLTRLGELSADTPCWTFDRQDPTAGFWRRRQLQEISIHRWDVSQHAIDPEIAADGINEVVGFFLPRQQATGRATLPPGTVVLNAGGRAWVLAEAAGPEVTISADPATLNLLLWGRRTLDDTTVQGDDAFAKTFFEAALTP
jgi:uncharacterized protein (TIGR03083 family)